MAISIDRLSGGNTPADGSDPRTFPAIWNATAAILEANVGEGGASVTVSETEPVDPTEGDLWLNSTEAKMYVYYNDGDSAQWVAAVGGTVPQQGKIIDVKHALFAGTQTAALSSGSSVDITDLSITHEVSSASNKLIISAFVGAAASSRQRGQVAIAVADGSGFINTGASPGSRTDVTAGGWIAANTSNINVTMPSFTHVHTPGAGSKTYTLKAINPAGASTVYINRAESDTDTVDRVRAVSSLMIMEVAV